MTAKKIAFSVLLSIMSFLLSSCKVTDHEILKDVQTQLTEITGDSSSNIQLTVAYGVVTISGYINDENSKQKIENTIKDLKHVKGVVNDLIVIPADSIKNVQY